MKKPCVTSVSLSPNHGLKKSVVKSISLVEGKGVKGDAHFGSTVQHRSRVRKDPTQPNLRQVHLLHEELLEALEEKGFSLMPGEMGENILTSGIDLLHLPTNTELCFSAGAVVKIAGLRNPCQQLNDFKPGLMEAVLDRNDDGVLIRKAGVMGVVIRGGEVAVSSLIDVTLPPLPHLKLERV